MSDPAAAAKATAASTTSAPAAPAPFNPELVIRSIPPSITTFSVPFSRGGLIPFGGRSTAVQLESSSSSHDPSSATASTGKPGGQQSGRRDVWLLVSHPLCEQTMQVLKGLGEVKYLVSPDKEHGMYLQQYKTAFPAAKLFAPSSLADQWKKEGKGSIDHVFGRGLDSGAADGVEGCPFEKMTGGEMRSIDFGKGFVNEDIAFLHSPSKTLIEADLLFNLPPTEQYSKSTKSTSALLFTKGMKPGTTFHKRMLWHLMAKDRGSMSRNAQKVADWDFDRIIPCHGDVIETGGKQAWISTYDWFLNGKN